MRTYSEIAETLAEMETRFPVNHWHGDNIAVWPLLRAWIYWFSTLPPHYEAKDRWLKNQFRKLQREARMVAKQAAAQVFERDRNLHYGSAGARDVVLYSDGVSFVNIDGRYYERFCDPIEDYFIERGVGTFKLTPHEPLLPRYSPSMLIGSRLRSIRARRLLRSRLVPSSASPQGFSEFAEFARRRLALEFSWPALERECFLINQYSRVFERVIRTLRARLGFLVSYYCSEGFAFCLACRRLGILSVDIQHGVQGDMHAAYGGWRNVPPDGYDLLPQRFLVWSEQEAHAIRQWSETETAHHLPLVAGNMFLDLCQAERLPAVTRGGAELQRCVQPGALQALYTLSFVDTPESVRQLKALIAATRQTERPIQWWIRLHPAGRGRLGEMQHIFQDAGLDPVQIRLATELPLYAILPCMDVHVTEFSSTIIEAASFGVASVATHSTGGELFPVQVSSGDLVVVDRDEEARKAIFRQAERRRSRSRLRTAADERLRRGRQALDELMTAARDAPLHRVRSAA